MQQPGGKIKRWNWKGEKKKQKVFMSLEHVPDVSALKFDQN